MDLISWRQLFKKGNDVRGSDLINKDGIRFRDKTEGKIIELKTHFKIPSDIQTWKHNSSVNLDTLRQIIMINPKSIVDAGAGDGFYGKLARRFINNCYITAIEKNNVYIEKFNLHSTYDSVINDDIVSVIKKVSGDLIIFGDILEHLEKKEMFQVLRESVKQFSYIIINSPLGFQPQEHEYPEERHLCGLEYSDFEDNYVLEFRIYDDIMFNCLIIGALKNKDKNSYEFIHLDSRSTDL